MHKVAFNFCKLLKSIMVENKVIYEVWSKRHFLFDSHTRGVLILVYNFIYSPKEAKSLEVKSNLGKFAIYGEVMSKFF